jgi:hypothetical protein
LAHQSISANKLGQIKDFGKLAMLAQDQGVEFGAASGSGMASQRQQANAEFSAIAQKIIERTSVSEKEL